MADLVVHESRHHRSLVAKALPQAAGRVVFAAAFPRPKRARSADPAFTGIETEHDLAEGNLVELAIFCGTDIQ